MNCGYQIDAHHVILIHNNVRKQDCLDQGLEAIPPRMQVIVCFVAGRTGLTNVTVAIDPPTHVLGCEADSGRLILSEDQARFLLCLMIGYLFTDVISPKRSKRAPIGFAYQANHIHCMSQVAAEKERLSASIDAYRAAITAAEARQVGLQVSWWGAHIRQVTS